MGRVCKRWPQSGSVDRRAQQQLITDAYRATDTQTDVSCGHRRRNQSSIPVHCPRHHNTDTRNIESVIDVELRRAANLS